MIKTLNEKFVNTWVFLRELPELVDCAKGEVARQIATKLNHFYSDSVDIFVLTPEAEVLMHQPEMVLPYRNRPQHYLTLLKHSVEAYEGNLLPKLEGRPICLGRKLKEVLHIFRAYGTDNSDYTLVEFETPLFDRGGILHIEINVGAGEAAGTFELFESDTDHAVNVPPNQALAGAWNVPPGGMGQIIYRFDRGRRFELKAAASSSSKEGSINAFLAQIHVVEEA